ncbi:hypothetical protein [Burkholderia ubonensis]|uniref:hypothetical protein n=1 Tax=Burkholderia ubonensis TaxID=101571 RepID=UPI0007540258|nr:hypothetical protein [Burkholderia ubonensis]KVN33254.1 hypothetical protein WJ64_11035 [Burkholderia ubonensis]
MNLEAEWLAGIAQCCLRAQPAGCLEIAYAADLERLMDRLRQSAGRLIDYYRKEGTVSRRGRRTTPES